MKERPILFKGPLVLGILAGYKKQTRRLVTSVSGLGPVREFQRSDTKGWDWIMRDRRGLWNDLRHADLLSRCPHGAVGDRLWVRESIRRLPPPNDDCSVYIADGHGTVADCWPWKAKALPAIHCPRGLSRIDLEITEVRVQRLQDLTEEDAAAEGLRKLSKDGGATWKYGIPDLDGLPGTDNTGWPWAEWCVSARDAFAKLWDKVNGERASWASNPYVWAITFKRIRP